MKSEIWTHKYCWFCNNELHEDNFNKYICLKHNYKVFYYFEEYQDLAIVHKNFEIFLTFSDNNDCNVNLFKNNQSFSIPRLKIINSTYQEIIDRVNLMLTFI